MLSRPQHTSYVKYDDTRCVWALCGLCLGRVQCLCVRWQGSSSDPSKLNRQDTIKVKDTRAGMFDEKKMTRDLAMDAQLVGE